ncbi:succinylglutamate desuccinylase/aspartoacylase family protein [Erwiniaceae bacterium L1_54_6]|nr:succinylglutamate desuccinylase/aspartoacylase family protein [Erwiniaceae bacterium L1_54_6]
MSTVFSEIDFHRQGKQVGFAHLPLSAHTDAWGTIAMPLTVIANGSGPTVLITGGIHGDEYEGPIIINELIRNLTPDQVQGRLILLPCANTPALRASMRVSPLDNKNLARVFPGNPWGTPTEQIAAWIHETIFPLCDFYIDLHSGGSSLFIEESAQVVVTEELNPQVRERSEAMARAFGATLTVVTNNMGDPRTSCGAAANLGLPAIAAEMGWNGSVSPRGVQRTRAAVTRVLNHLGVISAEVVPAEPSRQVFIPAGGNLLSPGDGWFEPLHDIGDEVSAGELAGWLHRLTEPHAQPQAVHFPQGGCIYSQRTFGATAQGNSLAVLVQDLNPKEQA